MMVIASRVLLAAFVALVLVVIFTGCGPEEEYVPFKREEAVKIAEKEGYDVYKCYPEHGGNFDCLVDAGVWLHVREDGSMELTDARENVKLPVATPEPTATSTPEPEEEFVP
jgi:hypothetical protein